MKLSTLAILCLLTVVAWPIAKDAAISKMVNTYARSAGLTPAAAGPLGATLGTSLMRGIASSMLDDQDLGTQIEVVFRALALGDLPPIPRQP